MLGVLLTVLTFDRLDFVELDFELGSWSPLPLLQPPPMTVMLFAAAGDSSWTTADDETWI